MSKAPRGHVRLPDWLISMDWKGLNPRTAVLQAVRLLCLRAVPDNRDGEDMEAIEEDEAPGSGLTVRIGNTLLVHLFEDRWELRDDEKGSR